MTLMRKTKPKVRIVYIILLLGSFLLARAEDSAYSRITTGSGVSLKIPSNWTVFNEDRLNTIRASSEGLIELLKVTESQPGVILHATYRDGEVYGSMRLARLPSEIFSREIISVVIEDPELLDEMAGEMRNQLEAAFAIQGVNLISFDAPKATKVANIPAYSIKYVRSPVVGESNVVVEQIHFPYPDGTKIILTTSFSQDSALVMLPIVEMIKSSVLLKR